MVNAAPRRRAPPLEEGRRDANADADTGRMFSWLTRLADVCMQAKVQDYTAPKIDVRLFVMKCCRDLIGGTRDVDNDWLSSR